MLSLLDLLAKRKEKKGQSGQILLNGKKRLPGYKRAVGYVVQVITYTKTIHFVIRNWNWHNNNYNGILKLIYLDLPSFLLLHFCSPYVCKCAHINMTLQICRAVKISPCNEKHTSKLKLDNIKVWWQDSIKFIHTAVEFRPTLITEYTSHNTQHVLPYGSSLKRL